MNVTRLQIAATEADSFSYFATSFGEIWHTAPTVTCHVIDSQFFEDAEQNPKLQWPPLSWRCPLGDVIDDVTVRDLPGNQL